jgi:hypothetical protein
VEVDRDVARLVAVDELHRAVAHLVGDVVVERAQQGDVEDQLAGRDVRVRDLRRGLPDDLQEVRPEPRERRALLVRAVAVDVVVAREPRRDRGVAPLVGDERGEDLPQRRIGGLVALDLEQRAGEPLDPGHVDERLADRLLLVARHPRRRDRPVEVVDRPLIADALVEHARQVHARKPSPGPL